WDRAACAAPAGAGWCCPGWIAVVGETVRGANWGARCRRAPRLLTAVRSVFALSNGVQPWVICSHSDRRIAVRLPAEPAIGDRLSAHRWAGAGSAYGCGSDARSAGGGRVRRVRRRVLLER